MDTAHVLDDGGGRELAYVAMSRSRYTSHVYTAAGDLRDAAERLAWSWDQERRERWITDRRRAAGRIEALRAERRRLVAMIPPDVSAQLAHARQELAALERDLADLQTGAGRWVPTSVGDAFRELRRAQAAHGLARCRVEEPGLSIFGRRRARHDVQSIVARVEEAEHAARRASEAHAVGLGEQQARLADQVSQLEARQRDRVDFIRLNTRVIDRVREIGSTLNIQRAPTAGSRRSAGGSQHIDR